MHQEGKVVRGHAWSVGKCCSLVFLQLVGFSIALAQQKEPAPGCLIGQKAQQLSCRQSESRVTPEVSGHVEFPRNDKDPLSFTISCGCAGTQVSCQDFGASPAKNRGDLCPWPPLVYEKRPRLSGTCVNGRWVHEGAPLPVPVGFEPGASCDNENYEESKDKFHNWISEFNKEFGALGLAPCVDFCKFVVDVAAKEGGVWCCVDDNAIACKSESSNGSKGQPTLQEPCISQAAIEEVS